MNLYPNMIEIPWEHQLEEFENYRDIRSRALLWCMRSGKTKTSIDKACYRHLQFGMKGLIVVAPNGVHGNWILEQFPKHQWKEVNVASAIWISSQSHKKEHQARLEILEDFNGLRVLAVNPEALLLDRVQKVIKRFLKACGKRNVGFIGDESHIFRRASARRTKIARDLSWQCHWREILTGTVILNSPFHAYSQFDFLRRGALGFSTLGEFKKFYGTFIMAKRFGQKRKFPQLVSYKNLEDLRESLSYWSSVVTRDSIKDMPPLLETDRPIYLSPPQVKAYKRMVKDTIVELEGQTIRAEEGKGKIFKLQQILGGFVLDKNKVLSIDDNPPRLDAMTDEVTGTLPGKTLIWCQFTEDIRRVLARLKKEGIKAVPFHGKISQSNRVLSRKLFEKDNSVKVLVGQTSVGIGYEMLADTVIFYSHGDDAIARNQAKERATKIGGSTVTLVDFYTPGSIEVRLRSNLTKKHSIADLISGRGLLEALRETSI